MAKDFYFKSVDKALDWTWNTMLGAGSQKEVGQWPTGRAGH
jgi:hypothetical protein